MKQILSRDLCILATAAINTARYQMEGTISLSEKLERLILLIASVALQKFVLKLKASCPLADLKYLPRSATEVKPASPRPTLQPWRFLQLH